MSLRAKSATPYGRPDRLRITRIRLSDKTSPGAFGSARPNRSAYSPQFSGSKKVGPRRLRQPRPELSEGPRPPSVKAFGPGDHSDVSILALLSARALSRCSRKARPTVAFRQSACSNRRGCVNFNAQRPLREFQQTAGHLLGMLAGVLQ